MHHTNAALQRKEHEECALEAVKGAVQNVVDKVEAEEADKMRFCTVNILQNHRKTAFSQIF